MQRRKRGGGRGVEEEKKKMEKRRILLKCSWSICCTERSAYIYFIYIMAFFSFLFSKYRSGPARLETKQGKCVYPCVSSVSMSIQTYFMTLYLFIYLYIYRCIYIYLFAFDTFKAHFSFLFGNHSLHLGVFDYMCNHIWYAHTNVFFHKEWTRIYVPWERNI